MKQKLLWSVQILTGQVGNIPAILNLVIAEDLDSLYDDMETVGGSLYIPDRAVELTNRRAISRNTHYMLTESEAEEIRKDSRVLSC